MQPSVLKAKQAVRTEKRDRLSVRTANEGDAMKPIEPLEQPRLLTESEQGEAKLAAARIVAELSEKYDARLTDDDTLRLHYDSPTSFKWPIAVVFDIPHNLVHVDVQSDILLESGAEITAWEFYSTRKVFKYKHFSLCTLPPGAPLDQEVSWEADQIIHSRFSSPIGAWSAEKIVELPANTLCVCEKDLRRAASAHGDASQDERPDNNGSLHDLLHMLRAMND